MSVVRLFSNTPTRSFVFYACAGYVSGDAGVGVQQFRVYSPDGAAAVAVQQDFDRPARRQAAAHSISAGQGGVPVRVGRLRTVPRPILDVLRRRPRP